MSGRYPDIDDRALVPWGSGVLCSFCGDEVKADLSAYQLALTNNTVKLFCNREQAELWKSVYPYRVVSG